MKKIIKKEHRNCRVTFRLYERFELLDERPEPGIVCTPDNAITQIIWHRSPKARRMDRARLKRQKRRWALVQELSSPHWRLKQCTIACEIGDDLKDLLAAAEAGDGHAAVSLRDIAVQAARGLNNLDTSMLRSFACVKEEWPCLATRETGWESRANTLLKRIQFGEETFEGRLWKPQGSGSPARDWARRIIRTLESNRVLLFAKDQQLAPELRSVLKRRWPDHEFVIIEPPQWARAAVVLKPFGPDTMTEWWQVGKEMLRQQYPDFHEHPDWQLYSKRWEDEKKGVKQNRILDLIESALERLAGSAVKAG